MDALTVPLLLVDEIVPRYTLDDSESSSVPVCQFRTFAANAVKAITLKTKMSVILIETRMNPQNLAERHPRTND